MVNVPRLVATHGREFDRKQPAGLLDNGREQLLRRRPARHQRRDPPQRRLLLGEPRELPRDSRVRDRGRTSSVNLGEPRLGVRAGTAPRLLEATITPHSRPSTTIGPPTEEGSRLASLAIARRASA